MKGKERFTFTGRHNLSGGLAPERLKGRVEGEVKPFATFFHPFQPFRSPPFIPIST
jgi:hypothetical protein